MTIDEAIEREKLNEEMNRDMMNTYHTDEGVYLEMEDAFRDRADYHRQLTEWLKELKKYRVIFEKVGKILADNGYTMDDLDTIFGKVNGEVNADEISN